MSAFRGLTFNQDQVQYFYVFALFSCVQLGTAEQIGAIEGDGRLNMDAEVDEFFDHDPRPVWLRVNPKDGLSLWDAMLFYGDRHNAEIAVHRRLEGFAGPPFTPFEEMTQAEQREYNRGSMQYERARRHLENEIFRELLSGALFATGYSSNSALDVPAARILTDRWRLLEPNFLESTADGGGVHISGILVFNAKQHALPVTLPKRHSPAELRKWYAAWVASSVNAGERPSRDADLEAARKKFGDAVHRPTLRTLRKELAPSEWTAHGRRRSD
jgi:hypothetical protein